MGSIYACLALALVMIYQSTNHINFAQGEMAMLSTFVAYLCVKHGLPYWASFLVAVGSGFLLGVVVERVILRHFRSASDLTVVVVFMGLFIGFNSIAGLIFGNELQDFPTPFKALTPLGRNLLTGHEIGTIGVAVLVVLVLYSFLRFTRLGLAMRAAAENPTSSRLSGVPASALLSLGWGISAAIGAVAGLMVAPVVFLDPNMMGGVLIYAFAAALLGGIDSPWGAVVGGIAVGVIENLAGNYVVGTELKLTVALLLIVGVLLVRPSGLFGRRVVTRV
ncbi:branched-chain amino acid ABC transporter permease [soil metagenome]